MVRKKRKRDSTTPISALSIADLPTPIFCEILLKLPVTSIVFCKCVCKAWHGLISDPQFAKLHFAQSKTSLLVRDVRHSRISRALYLLDREDGRDFSVGYCWCGSYESACNHIIKLKSKLKIPLRNAEAMLNHVEENPNAVFGTTSHCKRRDFVKLTSEINDHIYSNISSCNGLLCLADDSSKDCLAVCNPVTGEFIYLPKSRHYETINLHYVIGFGFSLKNNQYKVLQVFYTTAWLSEGSDKIIAEIHTLGTNTWRNVDISVFKPNFIHSPTYFEGALYWFVSDNSTYDHRIVYFELDEEQFQSHSAPPPLCVKKTGRYLGMGVLRDCLCLFDDFSDHGSMDIWAMSKYGATKSWTKLYSIDISKEPWDLFRRRCQPICSLNNGAILMFDDWQKILYYYDQSKGLRFKHFSSRVNASEFKVIAHTPSFVSLKDIVITSNVEVFNINSRCGKIKLLEDDYPVFLECGKRSN